jgi:hypothetical protein
MMIKIFLFFCGVSFCSFGTELSEFSKFKGGYIQVVKQNYVLIIDKNFTEGDADSAKFKKLYYANDVQDLIVSRFIASNEKKREIIPFKPTLTALLIANIPINIDDVELLDSSLDVGFFVAEDGVLVGGVVQFHAFSGVFMGSRFHKVVRLEFNGDYISERLQNIPEETLPDYFVN